MISSFSNNIFFKYYNKRRNFILDILLKEINDYFLYILNKIDLSTNKE